MMLPTPSAHLEYSLMRERELVKELEIERLLAEGRSVQPRWDEQLSKTISAAFVALGNQLQSAVRSSLGYAVRTVAVDSAANPAPVAGPDCCGACC